MAIGDAPKTAPERVYWTVVRACLVELHGFSPRQAEHTVAEFRERLHTRASPLANALATHAEPFDVACDLAQDSLDYFEYQDRYSEIVSRALRDVTPAALGTPSQPPGQAAHRPSRSRHTRGGAAGR
jgi:hypothetical protein